LKRLVRDDDLVCRLGGDEFIILLIGASRHQAECKAEQIIKELSSPILINHSKSARVGVSIGIAISPEHSENPEDLISLADQALYQAKAAGKGMYCTAPFHGSHTGQSGC
jgi:diguanylate cyclase (GGDEF)-like protein